ncbi:MAG: hypothetical protein PHI79_05780 [Sulfurovaceae bacterium]|nr:hypothetical protein [Sulfurovaceae bacterium]MDD5549087.1 hypothetical protein [Sulfurovaceae bacterium]
MTKEALKYHIGRIASMGAKEIEKMRYTISTSTCDKLSKDFLYRACDAREQQLDKTNAMAVDGDIDDL